MAKCGINTIPIGKTQVPADRISRALKGVEGITDLNTAIAKSFDDMFAIDITFEQWDKFYRNFNKPKDVNVKLSDITKNNEKNDLAKRLADLLNLAKWELSGTYEVGNYAKRIFNRVKNNLLAKGQGLTNQEINTLMRSLKSVLTRDRLLKDARKLRKQARKNIRTKIGANPDLRAILDKVFFLEPEAIPPEKMEVYNRLLEEFGQRKKVLTLREAGEVISDAKEFLDGFPDYMFEKTKVNQETVSDVNPQTLISQIKSKVIDISKLTNPTEKEWAKDLANMTPEFLATLDNDQLQTIIDSIENINNGYFHPALADVIIDIRANQDVEVTTEKVKGVKPDTWRNIISRKTAALKSLITDRSKFAEVIRSNPLTVIDEFFGNTGKEIYNATFGKLASVFSKYQTEVKGISDQLARAEEILEKKFKGNKLAKAKFQMKFYQMQREFEANPNEGLEAAIEWLDATIEDESLTGFYNEHSMAILKEMRKEFAGKSAEQIYSTFSKEQKAALEVMDSINERIAPKVLFTAGVLRGEQVKMFNFYTHHNVTDTAANAEVNLNNRRSAFVSAKSGVVNERTPGVKAISFDPFYDVSTSARGLLLDYYMTPVNREVLRITERVLKNTKDGTKEQQLAAKALKETVLEVLQNVFDANNKEYSKADALVNDIKNLGYFATLASLPRAIAEFSSNLAFGMFASPTAMVSGMTKYRKSCDE